MTEKEKKDEANLTIIRIEARHCWKCGCVMNRRKNSKKSRTTHHAIPKFLRPKRNVEVPICVGCHKEINKFNIQSIPKNFNSLKNFLEGLKAIINKYEKVLEPYFKNESK